MPLFIPPYVKSGLAKSSDGTLDWGIPTNVGFIGAGTRTFAVNRNIYSLIRVEYPVTLNAWKFEVTAAPATNANLAIGIYKASANLQPSGAPFFDSGPIAIASGFTGLKTNNGLNIPLTPAIYMVVVNVDTAMDLRLLSSPSPIIDNGISSSPIGKRIEAPQTFGAYPNPGTQWIQANLVTDVTGMQNFIVWQWTE